MDEFLEDFLSGIPNFLKNWEFPVRLFLVTQVRGCSEEFFQFMVALCMAITLDIPEDDTERVKILKGAFVKAEFWEAWYFQHLPEDKLEEVDDYLEEAAEKLRGDEFDDSEFHLGVIENYGDLY